MPHQASEQFLLRRGKKGQRDHTTGEGRVGGKVGVGEGRAEEGVGGQGAAGEEGVQDPVEGDAFVAKGRKGGRKGGRRK